MGNLIELTRYSNDGQTTRKILVNKNHIIMVDDLTDLGADFSGSMIWLNIHNEGKAYTINVKEKSFEIMSIG